MNDAKPGSTERRESLFDYLSYCKYVTLADAWEAMKSWVFVSAFLLAMVLGGDYLLSIVGEKLGVTWDSVPGRVYLFVAFAVIFWFLRGTEITVPESRGLWLFLVLFFGAVLLVSFWLPPWATVFFWFISATTVVWVVVLAELGAQNYQKLHGDSDANAQT